MPHIPDRIRVPRAVAPTTSAAQIPQLGIPLTGLPPSKPKIGKTNKINRAGKYPGLSKISLRNWDVDPREIARELGVK